MALGDTRVVRASGAERRGRATIFISGSLDSLRNSLPDDGSYEPYGGKDGSSQTAGLMPSTNVNTMPTQGATTYSTNNASMVTISGIRFTGKVTVTGQNYKFKNCRMTSFDSSSVNVSNIIIEDCEIGLTADTAARRLVAFNGHSTTLRRVWFHHIEDAMRPYRDGMTSDTSAVDLNFRAYGCVVEDHIVFVEEAQSDGYSHADGTQIQGGDNVLFRGNKFSGFMDATVGAAQDPDRPAYPSLCITCSFIFSPALADIGTMTFDRNWIDGGAVSFNFNSSYGNGNRSVGMINITNNHWGVNQRLGQDFTILRPAGMETAGPGGTSVLTVTGNTRPDGSSYNGKRNG